jgi:hypothetical protein
MGAGNGLLLGQSGYIGIDGFGSSEELAGQYLRSDETRRLPVWR